MTARRARGEKEYTLPFKGLNTEANLLHFPQEFSPDLLNMEIDYDPQMVRPRKGIEISTNNRLVETRTALQHNVGISYFLWESVDRDPDKDFIVLQVGLYLYFFDKTGLSDPSTSILAVRYDLTNSLSGTTKGTVATMEPQRVVMENVKGKLIVTAESIDPVIISYDSTADTIQGSKLNLRIRDTLGIEDGLEVDNHPTTLSDDHKYNLLNQGWYKQRRLTTASAVESDPITDYFGKFTPAVYPSNADVVWVGMVDSSGDLIFDAEWLRDQTFGSTLSARGHYVVDAFNIDRGAILLVPGSSGSTSGGSSESPPGLASDIGGWETDPPVALP